MLFLSKEMLFLLRSPIKNPNRDVLVQQMVNTSLTGSTIWADNVSLTQFKYFVVHLNLISVFRNWHKCSWHKLFNYVDKNIELAPHEAIISHIWTNERYLFEYTMFLIYINDLVKKLNSLNIGINIGRDKETVFPILCRRRSTLRRMP